MSEYCRTESGRVFKREPGVRGAGWLMELSDGKFVEPLSPITGGALMDAEVLSESEVEKLLKSGG